MRNFVRLAIAASLLALPLSCTTSQPDSVELGWTPNAPTVYRVSVSNESALSGPASNLEGRTDLTTALRVVPTSQSEAEVEVMYLAASVADASGEMVALDLDGLSGEVSTVRFNAPGVVSSVESSERLRNASVPLVSMEHVVASLFPALPEGSFRPGDTWTSDETASLPNLGDAPVRMRYVMQNVRSSDDFAEVEGYELSVRPREFEVETAEGGVTSQGDLNVEFYGELGPEGGYERTETTADFESDYIRLEGGEYANGNVRMRSDVTVERLSPTEQFGLDP